ncbi:hypothetical protein [Streptomyces sp. NPDC091294]|uniref:hypothetical protein n=1 Tax=Streptomyces sp. NPDC091294 TaxID=3365992 RepID=UPI0038139A6E
MGAKPLGVDVDSETGRVCVGHSADGTVSVIDGHSAKVTAIVAVGTFPLGVGTDSGADTTQVANRTAGTVSALRG